MNAIGIALVWCVVQVSLLAAVTALLYRFVRRSGPPARALVAFAGLVVIAGLTGLAFSPWPDWKFQRNPTSNVELAASSSAHGLTGDNPSSAPAADVSAESRPDQEQSRLTNDPQAPTAASIFFQALLEELGRAPAAAERETWRWPAFVAVLLLVGTGLGLVRLLAGLAAVRSYRLAARPINDARLHETADVLLAELRAPRTVTLCESERLATPATIGWRRPLVILPAGWKSWTSDECRAVLAHELAHIARHDFPTWVAAQVALVFHFYHPLVHWLAARLRLEQELAADAEAARLAGGQHTYLTTLAAMALRQSDQPLAWPARTFLPTRGTFMRRIEMLRDERRMEIKTPMAMRIGITALLVTAGLAVAGLRGTAADRGTHPDRSAPAGLGDEGVPPTAPDAVVDPDQKSPGSSTSGSSASSQASGSSSSNASTNSDPFALAWVPRDAAMVMAIRPAELLRRPNLAELKKSLLQRREVLESLKISPERIEQLKGVVFVEPGTNGSPAPTAPELIVSLVDAQDASALMKALQPEPEEQEYAGRKYFRSKGAAGWPICFLADERTVVVTSNEEHLRRMIIAGKTGAAKAKWTEVWQYGSTADLAVLVNANAVRQVLSNEFEPPQQAAAATKLSAFSPLWQGTTAALLYADLHNQLAVTLRLPTTNPKEAQKVRDTLAAVVTLGQNSLSQVRAMASRQPGGDGAALLGAIDMLDSLLDSINFNRIADGQVMATASVDAEEAATLAGFLLPAVSNARSAARRAQSTNNLKQLALAMYNYHDVNQSFPPAILYGPDGKTPYSWRVALLPYLNEAALYEQYQKNEPWDSPANKQVLLRMPPVFRDPGDAPDSFVSSCYAITGPSTIFFGNRGAKMADITDGTSNTLMFVEAKRDIPWTKPEDIPYTADLPRAGAPDAPGGAHSRYAANAPLPKFGGHYPGGFLAAIADGRVQFISNNLDPASLRAVITRDGGEPIGNALDNPPPTGLSPPVDLVPPVTPKPAR